jgi:DNA-binding GntR family transcriptional regulator
MVRGRIGYCPSRLLVLTMATHFSPTALTATLSIQIADQLGAAILEEKLAPGERIREVSLAEAFNVSRATVRDALRILETRGLVSILPQRGAKVTLLSASELHNLFEIRAMLLALASRRAAAHFRPEHEAVLRATLKTLKDASGDANAYARASATMIGVITQISDNAQLTELIMGFAQRIGRYARLGLLTVERRQRSLANWEALVEAIVAGNHDLAEETHRRLALENRDAAMVIVEARERQPEGPRAAGQPRRAPADGSKKRGRTRSSA